MPATATKNGGLCAPCKGGYRIDGAAAKKWLDEHKALAQQPDAIFWKTLVHRVYELGFETLNDSEKIYFAVCMLEGDVYNGGFEQFFSNSSAKYYPFAVKGLKILSAENSLRLLLEAKQLLFGESEIPDDFSLRHKRLLELGTNSVESQISQALDVLDSRFYKDSDSLCELIRQFAIENKLWTESS